MPCVRRSFRPTPSTWEDAGEAGEGDSSDKVAVDETTNFKLVGRKGEETSDAGKTILNMSRGNYAQAVYLDTLNKRMGEMRFSKGREDGLWARTRYDHLGLDGSYEIDNTMIEIGVDSLHRTESGEAHYGIAFDYMLGDTDYKGVIGGDVMHEFMGGQDVLAQDKTGVLRESYENEGTWYSIGAGFSVMTSKDLYFYFEGEKILGNSNDGSFTLSGGLRYLF